MYILEAVFRCLGIAMDGSEFSWIGTFTRQTMKGVKGICKDIVVIMESKIRRGSKYIKIG